MDEAPVLAYWIKSILPSTYLGMDDSCSSCEKPDARADHHEPGGIDLVYIVS